MTTITFFSSFEGKMDAFWDRGSLVAINEADYKRLVPDLTVTTATSFIRYIHWVCYLLPELFLCLSWCRYSDVIKELCAPGARCLLATYDYDSSKYAGEICIICSLIYFACSLIKFTQKNTWETNSRKHALCPFQVPHTMYRRRWYNSFMVIVLA